MKETCIKTPRRRRKDPPTINVVGRLVDIMLGKVITPKYDDIGIPIVIVQINDNQIPKTLIDHIAAINVMTRDTMLNMNLQSSLRHTPTILQLGDSSIVCPEGMLKDITIIIDSWEYPMDFIVLDTKSKLSGYPLIFGMPP